jgi:hypothetical protein
MQGHLYGLAVMVLRFEAYSKVAVENETNAIFLCLNHVQQSQNILEATCNT